jgi:hypothetical protein
MPDIERIGRHLYGTTALATIIERSRSDPRDRFISADQLLELSTATVLGSEDLSSPLFFHLPSQNVVVKPLPEHQQGTGVSSSYEANADRGRRNLLDRDGPVADGDTGISGGYGAPRNRSRTSSSNRDSARIAPRNDSGQASFECRLCKGLG